jgi:hypothetical protein
MYWAVVLWLRWGRCLVGLAMVRSFDVAFSGCGPVMVMRCDRCRDADAINGARRWCAARDQFDVGSAMVRFNGRCGDAIGAVVGSVLLTVGSAMVTCGGGGAAMTLWECLPWC